MLLRLKIPLPEEEAASLIRTYFKPPETN
jgi:hypothetical protein